MQKIFISSTFRDMQAERDAIHTTVVPELRRIAQKYGEDVELTIQHSNNGSYEETTVTVTLGKNIE